MSAHAGGVCMSQCAHWRIPQKEKRDRQQKYLTVMALMKEMRSGGIIDKDELLIVEAVFAEQFKPIWRYKDFEL